MRLGGVAYRVIRIFACGLCRVGASLNRGFAICSLDRDRNRVALAHARRIYGGGWNMSASVVDEAVASPRNANRLRRYLEVEERGTIVVADALHVNVAVSDIDVSFVGNLVVAALDVIGVGAGNRGLVLRFRIDLVGRVAIEELIVEVLFSDVEGVGLLTRVVADAFDGDGARIIAGIVIVAVSNRVVGSFRNPPNTLSNMPRL